ncbi:hypothetical protein ACFRK5_13585 [Streptomyces niveus]|uniref:hypothetical protein n=1 Tax=Streptomyces niveus TaxID=193462 RepID=UPI00368E170D
MSYPSTVRVALSLVALHNAARSARSRRWPRTGMNVSAPWNQPLATPGCRIRSQTSPRARSFGSHGVTISPPGAIWRSHSCGTRLTEAVEINRAYGARSA